MTGSAKQSRATTKLDRFVALLPGANASRLSQAMTTTIHPNSTHANFDLTGELNVSRYPPCTRRDQKASGLSRRGRRLALSARWPLHRTSWPLQSPAAQG